MSNQNVPQTAFSLSQGPLSLIFPPPIVSKTRAPTVNDIGYQLGQIWVYRGNSIYILENVAAGIATWINVSGGSGTFSSLTVTPGPSTLTGAFTVNSAGNPVNIATDSVASTTTIGNATGASSVVINGGTGAMSFGANAIAHTTTVGSTTGAASTVIQGGTAGITLTAPFVALPGPVYIYSGAGVPAGALALHIGDLYINTTAASATTRMYIATAVGTFTNITCAA